MKKVFRLFLLLILFLLLPACRQTDEVLSGMTVQPYVNSQGQMGLSVWMLDDSKSQAVSLIVTNPEGNLKWNVPVGHETFEDVSYLGSSDITMPSGIELPKGKWSLTVVFKNGKTSESQFNVNYGEIDKALERSENKKLPFYDETTNITVIEF